jgi:hypothetical protein
LALVVGPPILEYHAGPGAFVAPQIVENKNRMENRFRQAIRYISIISFLATRVPIIPANVGCSAA